MFPLIPLTEKSPHSKDEYIFTTTFEFTGNSCKLTIIFSEIRQIQLVFLLILEQLS